MKLKLSLILFLLLIIFSYLFTQTFSIEKVEDIYIAENYRKLERYENYILASGERALHLLTNDENGNLIELDELPLWGHLGASIYSEFVSLEVINNNIYLFGEAIGETIDNRLYRVTVENDSLILLNSVNYYGVDRLMQVLGVNEHLFVIPYFSSGTVQIYYNEDFEIVTEFDLLSIFNSTLIYKINDQFLYTLVYNMMHIYDVSDIYNIQEVAILDFNGILPENQITCPVMINDTTLCICYPELYSIYDISDITNWQLLSTIEFTNTLGLFNLAVLNEDRIMIPNADNSVSLYDISNIEEPILLSTTNFDKIYNIDGCTTLDNYFYRVDSGLGIHQFSIENDQIEYFGPFPEFTTVRSTYIHDDLLAVRTSYWRGMHFFDISDFGNSQYICTHFNDHIVYGCDFEDNYLAVPLSTYPEYRYSINIYDITNIEDPLLINCIENVYATDVFLDFPFIYARETVPNSYEYHFVKYDISEPNNPQIIYDFELSPHMHCFFKNRDYIYYRGGENTINILGNLDGDYPEVVTTLEIDGLLGFWPMNNDALYVARDNPTMELYSLENPTDPEYFFEYPYISENFGGGIEENLFFQGGYSINVFDIENGYNMYDPIYSFEMPHKTGVRYFIERDEENYVLFPGMSEIPLYRYNYDNTSLFEDEIHCNKNNLSNYPNPFNPETMISFNLTTEITESTKLIIYNIKGQKVKDLSPSLCHPEFIEGRGETKYSVIWDGTDSNNKSVSSGIYMYQLKVDGKAIASKKCLLLK